MKVIMKILLMALIFTANVYANPSDYPFLNLEGISNHLNFKNFYQNERSVPRDSSGIKRKIKIAIFDTGFLGYEQALGTTLPQTIVSHPATFANNLEVTSHPHGTGMAQIIHGLMTNFGRNLDFEPEFYFYNTYGFRNFADAVEDCIERDVDKNIIGKKVDMIVHAQVFDSQTLQHYNPNDSDINFDGHGYYNDVINQATEANIIVVNSAGNYGRLTYNGDIGAAPATDQSEWVDLPEENNTLLMKCNAAKDSQCRVMITLSWTDEGYTFGWRDADLSRGESGGSLRTFNLNGTRQDLDLHLYGPSGHELEINQGKKKQIRQGDEVPNGVLATRSAKEKIQTFINPGQYKIKISKKGSDFNSNSRFRIVLNAGPEVELVHFDPDESLLSPADNPNVITVGALDSDMSSYSQSFSFGDNQKPEIFTPSVLEIREGSNLSMVATGRFIRDTSPAAAIMSAAIGLVQIYEPGITKQQIIAKLATKPRSQNTLELSGVYNPEQNENCYLPIDLRRNPQLAGIGDRITESYLGQFVQTSKGIKLMVNFDPVKWLGLEMNNPFSDGIVLSSNSAHYFPRNFLSYTRSGVYQIGRQGDLGIEIIHRPQGDRLCGLSNGAQSFLSEPVSGVRSPYLMLP